MKKRKIAILGATGSIGKNACQIIKENQDKFSLEFFLFNKNIKEAINILNVLKPKYFVTANKEVYEKYKRIYKNLLYIRDLEKIYQDLNIDLTLSAIPGSEGIYPTYLACKYSNICAISNKESIVCAYEFLKKERAKIILCDSEHTSLKELLKGEKKKEIEKLILTASGGPFWELSLEELKHVTFKDALKHPSWNMGPKITIDSASFMNKAFEIIEAALYFEIKNIDVFIHRKSFIHAIVKFIDKSYKFSVSIPDMKIVISYCLNYPNRLKLNLKSLEDLLPLDFKLEEKDLKRFKCLKFGFLGIKNLDDILFRTLLVLGDDLAIKKFAKGEITFLGIYNFIKNFIENNINKFQKPKNIPELLEIIKIIKEENNWEKTKN